MTDLRSRLARTLGGAYAIERELSGGGMSHVFVAEERAFGRRVVVKVLREDLIEGVSAERFKREISVAARLQHPHIVPLLTAGDDGQTLYYTMPFVDGESLRDRLTREGELPVAHVIRVMREVATALAYAHRRGIIHRDIKPENVLFSDGSAVVTDFGIAKALEVARTAGDVRAKTITQFGFALGTPTYMAPEQAAADPTIDHRADLYALGCVAYELLAGRPPYDGRTAQQLLAAHAVETPIPITVRRITTPPQLAAVVMQCLEKRPADRPQLAEDILRALDGIVVTPGDSVASSMVSPATLQSGYRTSGTWSQRRVGILSIGVAIAAAVSGLVAGRVLLPPPASNVSGSPMRFVTKIPAGTFIPDVPTTSSLVLAPDGGSMVYVGENKDGRQLFIKRVTELGASAVPGTAGATSPFFSPEGDWLAFFVGNNLKRVPVAGGPVQTIVKNLSGDQAHWSTNGIIAYQGVGGIEVMPADGGTARQITRIPAGDSVSHGWPFVLPSGDAVLFTVHNWVHGLEQADVAVVSLKTLAVHTVVKGAFNARLLPDGHLLFARATGTLDAVRFDPRTLLPIGRPVAVLDSVRIQPGGETDIGLARNGTLVYLPASTLNRRLMRVDRSGHPTPLLPAVALFEFPTLSPDGKHIAVRKFEPSGLNLWVYDERGAAIRLGPVGDVSEPAWTADSREIAVVANGSLHVMATDGSGTRRVIHSKIHGEAGSWMRDGRRLVMATRRDTLVPGKPVQGGIMLITRGDSVTVQELVVGPASQPAVSPDEEWLAYVLTENGQSQVYVRRLQGGTRQYPVSTGGGTEPRWGPGGRELFYRHGREVIAVPVRQQGVDIVIGVPKVLFTGRFVSMAGSRMWDVRPSGREFIMVEGQEVHDEFITVFNWLADISRRLGR